VVPVSSGLWFCHGRQGLYVTAGKTEVESRWLAAVDWGAAERGRWQVPIGS